MSDKDIEIEQKRLEALLEKCDTYIMSKDGRSRNDTEVILKCKQGKVYVNGESGIVAMFSSTGKNKVLSNKATGQSIQNGFTKEQHNEVASKIDRLFTYAYLCGIHNDIDNDINTKSIKRFVCPITIKKGINFYEDALAWITVKETKVNNDYFHRIYSIEEMKIEQLVKKGGEITTQGGKLFHDLTALPYILQNEINIVKELDKKCSPLLESTLKELDKQDRKMQNQNIEQEGENNER